MIVLKGTNINVCTAYYFKVGLTWQVGPVGKIFMPVYNQQVSTNQQPTGNQQVKC